MLKTCLGKLHSLCYFMMTEYNYIYIYSIIYSIMILNCELFQSELLVLSVWLIKNMFPLHICRPNDYTIETIVLLQIQFSFTIFLLMFFPLFSNVFTNILKIYQLPKIYNKILRKLLTIIIYQVNSVSQLHLAFEL